MFCCYCYFLALDFAAVAISALTLQTSAWTQVYVAVAVAAAVVAYVVVVDFGRFNLYNAGLAITLPQIYAVAAVGFCCCCNCCCCCLL